MVKMIYLFLFVLRVIVVELLRKCLVVVLVLVCFLVGVLWVICLMGKVLRFWLGIICFGEKYYCGLYMIIVEIDWLLLYLV